MIRNEELPYENKVVDLQRELFKVFGDDKDTVLAVSSCVSDYEEDVDELLRFIYTSDEISNEKVIAYAYDIYQARELGER